MPKTSTWTALAAPALVLGLIALVVVFADRRVEVPAADLRYFHARPDSPDAAVDLSYASMQVKSVAASRQVPVPDIRRLLDESTIERTGVAISRRHVDVPRLNRVLDERWPLK